MCGNITVIAEEALGERRICSCGLGGLEWLGVSKQERRVTGGYKAIRHFQDLPESP